MKCILKSRVKKLLFHHKKCNHENGQHQLFIPFWPGWLKRNTRPNKNRIPFAAKPGGNLSFVINEICSGTAYYLTQSIQIYVFNCSL